MMAEPKQVIEVRAPGVDEAIEKGLAQLGVSRGEVDVEVVDAGSSGFLGLGARHAVVRLARKPERAAAAEAGPAFEAEARKAPAELPAEPAALPAVEPKLPDEEIPEEEVAQNIVEILLQKMQVEATVGLNQTEPDDLTGEQRWIVEIRGSDLGLLIGTRGETLNALQSIARLMTGHVTRHRPSFIVDVEGYRERREQALARLARRMADKVIQGGRPVTLEPMPANERRIIHVTLRDHERVVTQSAGEGNHRRVQILPK
jgi:spoIIIJ-associated protein